MPIAAPAQPDTEIDEEFRSIVSNEDKPDDDDADDTGDHDRFSHYASKEDIAFSAVHRVPITALCGKKWTPRRDPQKYPVCPDCKAVYEQMRDE